MAGEEMGAGAAGLTQILQAAADGDPQSLSRLADSVYADLRRVCAALMPNGSASNAAPGAHGQLLVQPTDIVHEVYLRLVDQKQTNWKNRAHFFAIAARLIRRVLVDQARASRRLKRGFGVTRQALTTTICCGDSGKLDLLELEDSLDRLSRIDPLSGQIIELRTFGGLPEKAIADVLDVSDRTVRRHLAFARAWLYRDLFGLDDTAISTSPAGDDEQ